jgi:hypothetical protein
VKPAIIGRRSSALKIFLFLIVVSPRATRGLARLIP